MFCTRTAGKGMFGFGRRPDDSRTGHELISCFPAERKAFVLDNGFYGGLLLKRIKTVLPL